MASLFYDERRTVAGQLVNELAYEGMVQTGLKLVTTL